MSALTILKLYRASVEQDSIFLSKPLWLYLIAIAASGERGVTRIEIRTVTRCNKSEIGASIRKFAARGWVVQQRTQRRHGVRRPALAVSITPAGQAVLGLLQTSAPPAAETAAAEGGAS